MATEKWTDMPDAWKEAPTSYADPFYERLVRYYAKEHKVSEDLAVNVLKRGEHTDKDMVSSKGAKTPAQFYPPTRERFQKDYGKDPWNSPQEAMEGLVIHLKESLTAKRNAGKTDVERAFAAVGEYNGGPDWYKKPESIRYAAITTQTQPEQSRAILAAFPGAAKVGDEWLELADITRPPKGIDSASPGEKEPALTSTRGMPYEERRAALRARMARLGRDADEGEEGQSFALYTAYSEGKMDPEQRATYEKGVKDGTVPVPRGATELRFGIAGPAPEAPPVPMASEGALRRYTAAVNDDANVSDRFDTATMQKFEREVRKGNIRVPEGFQLRETAKPGWLDDFSEMVSGKKRATAETETAKDWWDLPEISDLGIVGYGSVLAAGPEEAARIIKANAPDVKVERDVRGNIIFTSAKDGQKYAVKPGWQQSDTARMAYRTAIGVPAVALGAAAAPAGFIGTVGGAVLGGVLEQGALEVMQGATPGGSFDVMDVGGAGVAAGLTAGAGAGLGAAGRRFLGSGPKAAATAQALNAVDGAAAQAAPTPAPVAPAAAPATVSRPAPQAPTVTRFSAGPEGAGTVRPVVETPAPSAATRELADPIVMAPEAKAATAVNADVDLTSQELKDLMREASVGGKLGFGKAKARKKLAEALEVDEGTIESAERLDILGHLQPDHLSTSSAVKQLFQSVKAMKGSRLRESEKAALVKVADRARGLVDELGGKTDMSAVNSRVKASMEETQKKLDDLSEVVWRRLKEKIGPGDPVEASSTMAFLRRRMATRNGDESELSALEKYVLEQIKPKEVIKMERDALGSAAVGTDVFIKKTKSIPPTYDMLDDVRKEVGAATRGGGKFKDGSDRGLADALYATLLEDQQRVAEKKGLLELFDSARRATRIRKSVEQDMTALFSKELNKSIVSVLNMGEKALSRGDVDTLRNIITKIPQKNRQEVVASGLASSFGNFQTSEAAMTSFMKWYGRPGKTGVRANKHAMDLLFANLPSGSKQKLDDVYKVFEAITSSTSERTNTGAIATIRDELERGRTPIGAIGRIYAAALESSGGAATAAFIGRLGPRGHAVSLFLSSLNRSKQSVLSAADDFINSPQFVEAVREQVRTGAVKPVTVRRVAASKPFKAYVASTGKKPKNLEEYEAIVLSLINARDHAETPTEPTMQPRKAASAR